MSDLDRALEIFERHIGPIGNVKFLLDGDMDIEAVSADLLAIASDVDTGKMEFHTSFPEPELCA